MIMIAVHVGDNLDYSNQYRLTAVSITPLAILEGRVAVCSPAIQRDRCLTIVADISGLGVRYSHLHSGGETTNKEARSKLLVSAQLSSSVWFETTRLETR